MSMGVPTICGRPTLWPWFCATCRRVRSSPVARAIARLHALQLGLGAMRHDRVERQGRQVEVEMARQDGEPALDRHQRVVLGLLVLGLGARGADDRLHAEQHLAGRRRTARLDHAALDVVVQRLGAGDVGLDGEHRVGIARREVAALARGAGLQDGGTSVCGERTTFSGPRDLKKRPSWSMRWTLSGSAKMPASRSMTTASSSQLAHSLRQTSMNSCARS